MSQPTPPPSIPAILQPYVSTSARDLGSGLIQRQFLLASRNLTIPVTDLNAVQSHRPTATLLLTQDQAGEQQEFVLPMLNGDPVTESEAVESPLNVVEIRADRQEYDERQRVVTAQGNVVIRFAQGVLRADQIRINLANQFAVAEGEVSLQRGEELLQGDRFEYSIAQDRGAIVNARGEVSLSAPTQTPTVEFPSDAGINPFLPSLLSDRILFNQPVPSVTPEDGFTFIVGGGGLRGFETETTSGQINRVRFQAERIEFEPDRWQASNIRLTNDPFSPPELEVRADTAQYQRLGPQQEAITTQNSRVVFDQRVSLPIFQNRLVLDSRGRDPAAFNVGFDGGDRGGLYIERNFNVINTPQVQLSLTPQYFLQKALFDEGLVDPSVFGTRARLDLNLTQRTFGGGSASLQGLRDFENNFRADFQLQQLIGDVQRPYQLELEYHYRERVFSGSNGVQTVQSRLGTVFSSPVFNLGDTGVTVGYQVGIHHLNADSDRLDLLSSLRNNDRISLTRFQASASASRGFYLWQGDTLPPTPTEGLRYTPIPVQPYLQLVTGVRGVNSTYTNGESQRSVSGTVGIQGQIGNFSRPYLDYTGFNLLYTQALLDGESPFIFDRLVDRRILSLGLIQQVYGPFRAGFQTALNLDTNQGISTDYFVEYNRRTYSLVLRYNPNVEIGSVSFRLNDFNWRGRTEPFEGLIRPVQQGI